MAAMIQLGKVPESPSKEQEIQMFEKYFSLPDGKEKDKQKQLIASHYLYFIHHIIKKKRNALKEMPYDDRFQQGVIGLMDAIDRFDIKKGFRFTSYASHYIFRSCVNELVTNDTKVKIPANKYFKLNQSDYSEICHGKEYFALKYVNLDDVVYNDDNNNNNNNTLVNFFSDPEDEDNVYLGATRYHHHKLIKSVFKSIKPVDKKIIKMCYGYGTKDKEYTLLDIGKKVGLSKERIRQRRIEALNTLRRTVASILKTDIDKVTHHI